MNLAFRSIWNQALGAWVAASETSRARGKGRGGLISTSGALVAGVLALGAAGAAHAQVVLQQCALTSATDTTTCAPSLGTVLYNTSNTADLNPGAMYWNGSRWIGLTPYFSVNSTVVGAGSNASSDGATGTNALAAGVNATAQSTNAVAVGTGATSGKVDGSYTVAPTGNVASQPNNTIAIGTGAQSSAESGIAIGSGAKVYQGWNFDSGGNPVANNYGVAIGSGATAINNNIVMGNVGAGNNLAAGSGTDPHNINNVTIGNGAGSGVTGNENVILGYQAATGMNSYGGNVAIGRGVATGATISDTVAIGNGAGNNAAGNGNVMIGAGTGAGFRPASAYSSTVTIACGAWSYYCQGAAGDGANNTLVGSGAGRGTAAGAVNVSVGFNAGQNQVGMLNTNVGMAAGDGAQGRANVWMGTQSGQFGKGNNNTGVGNFSGVSVVGNNNAALGNTAGNNVSGSNNAAVGNAAGNNLAAGSNNNNAFGSGSGSNISGVQNTAVGGSAGQYVTGNNNFAGSYNAGRYVTGNDNVALGRGAGQGTAAAPLAISRTVAVGQGSRAVSDDSIAVGTTAVAGATGKTNAIAMGNGAQALGQSSISIGTGNQVLADRSGAIGDPTTIIANATDSYSIGNNNNVNTADSFVMGNNVTTSVANSVYLGKGAAGEAALTSATAGMTNYPSSTINGVTYFYAGTQPTGVVTVGAPGTERRVQNMAAGLISATSTDAINGSQLYATNKAIEAISATTGAGWVITTGQTGSGVATGTDLSVVAAGSTAKFTAGDNIAVTQVGTEVQIATKPNLAVDSVTINHGGPVINQGGITLNAGNTLNMGGNKIVNLAPGTEPTDAVNVSQLNATNQYINQVDNRVTQVDNRVTQVEAVANRGWDLSTNGGPATNIKPGGLVNINQGSNVVVTQNGGNLTVGVVDSPTFTGSVFTNGGLNVSRYLTVQPGTLVNFSGNVIHNVGAGVQPGDAVNVQQLHDAENRSVQYARNPDGSVNYNSVPMRGDAYDPNTGQGGTTISNVAQGRNPSDAVNVQQLNNVANDLRGRIDEVDRRASAGTASAMAMTGIPQAYLPGKSLFGAGIGSYRGQAAIALGLSAVSDNGRWIVKGSLSRNSQGHTGVALGAGYQW